MSEREAFESSDFYFTGEDGRHNWMIWQAACAWQRERDAEICDGIVPNATPSDCAHAILNQGSKE